MGADWYYPQTWYGYSFLIPSKTSYASFMALVNPLCDFLPAPFQIVGILESFHSRMEMDCSGLDDMAVAILAFIPSKDLTQTSAWGKDLADYVHDSPVLMGLDLAPEPRFFSGIEWSPREEIEDEVDSDSSASTYTTSEDDPLAQSIESLASVESNPSSSASFLSDEDDTDNYHDGNNDGVEEADNYDASEGEMDR